MVRNICIIDLDHVIYDASHRDHLLPSKDWDHYHEQSQHDPPAKDIVALVRLLSDNGFMLIGLTGRSEPYRQITNQYLINNGVLLDELLMRGEDDYRKGAEMKLSMIEEHLGNHWQDSVLFVLDDNDKICEAFRAADVTVLQVYNRKYEK